MLWLGQHYLPGGFWGDMGGPQAWPSSHHGTGLALARTARWSFPLMSGKCCSRRDRDVAVLEPPARRIRLAPGWVCAQVCRGLTNPVRSRVLEQPGAQRSGHALQSGTNSDAAHCSLRAEGTADPTPTAPTLTGTFLLMGKGTKLFSASVELWPDFPPFPYLQSPWCALPHEPCPAHPCCQARAWHDCPASLGLGWAL